MAIQNFLSGGYYGKLGATVGQRWKNKRTIRTYVIPNNPRTEIQQANRGKFGDAVKFSQMGLQMNYYATCFESESYTKWNYRMATARALKNAQLTYLDLIPLYPINFNPPTLIDGISVHDRTTPGHITLSIPTLQGDTDRVFSIMLAEFSTLGVLVGYKLYVGYYYASNKGYVEVDVDDNSEFNERTLLRVISNDDTDSATDMIASPMLDLSGGHIVQRAFNAEILGVTKSLSGVVIQFAEPYREYLSVSVDVTVNGVSAGGHSVLSKSGQSLTNVNGYFGLNVSTSFTRTQQIFAFPAGSSIYLGDFTVTGSNFEYTHTAETIAYSDSDLSRSCSDGLIFDPTDNKLRATVYLNMGETTQSTATSSFFPGGQFDGESTYNTIWTLSALSTYTAVLVPETRWQNIPMRSGNWVTIPNINVQLSGVTYTIAGVTQQGVVNTAETSNYLEYEGTRLYTKSADTGEEIDWLNLAIDGLPFDLENDPTITTPATVLDVTNGTVHVDFTMSTLDIDMEMLTIRFDSESGSGSENLTSNSQVLYGEGAGSVSYKGIKYTFGVESLPLLRNWVTY